MIMSKQVQIREEDIPNGWSIEAADFFNKLLQRKPMNRLGIRGISELKNHPWYKDYDFNSLKEGKIPSPFIPQTTENIDKSYCDAKEKIGNETKERYREIINGEDFEKVFNDFFYINTKEAELLKRKYLVKKEVNIIEENSDKMNYFLKNINKNQYNPIVSQGVPVNVNFNNIIINNNSGTSNTPTSSAKKDFKFNLIQNEKHLPMQEIKDEIKTKINKPNSLQKSSSALNIKAKKIEKESDIKSKNSDLAFASTAYFGENHSYSASKNFVMDGSKQSFNVKNDSDSKDKVKEIQMRELKEEKMHKSASMSVLKITQKIDKKENTSNEYSSVGNVFVKDVQDQIKLVESQRSINKKEEKEPHKTSTNSRDISGSGLSTVVYNKNSSNLNNSQNVNSINSVIYNNKNNTGNSLVQTIINNNPSISNSILQDKLTSTNSSRKLSSNNITNEIVKKTSNQSEFLKLQQKNNVFNDIYKAQNDVYNKKINSLLSSTNNTNQILHTNLIKKTTQKTQNSKNSTQQENKDKKKKMVKSNSLIFEESTLNQFKLKYNKPSFIQPKIPKVNEETNLSSSNNQSKDSSIILKKDKNEKQKAIDNNKVNSNYLNSNFIKKVSNAGLIKEIRSSSVVVKRK